MLFSLYLLCPWLFCAGLNFASPWKILVPSHWWTFRSSPWPSLVYEYTLWTLVLIALYLCSINILSECPFEDYLHCSSFTQHCNCSKFSWTQHEQFNINTFNAFLAAVFLRCKSPLLHLQFFLYKALSLSSNLFWTSWYNSRQQTSFLPFNS